MNTNNGPVPKGTFGFVKQSTYFCGDVKPTKLNNHKCVENNNEIFYCKSTPDSAYAPVLPKDCQDARSLTFFKTRTTSNSQFF